MEGIYSKAQYLGKEKRIRKCRGSTRGIQRKNKCRSKEVGENRYGKRKKL